LLRESRLGHRYLKWIEERPVPFIERLALKPNHITFFALAVSLLTVPAYAYALWSGGCGVLLSGLLDTIDGGLARKVGRSTRSGAFLDSVLDRYGDFLAVLGIWVYFFFHPTLDRDLLTVLLFFFLSGSFLVSYAKARGEGLGLSASLGYFGRAERVIALGVGSIISGLLEVFFPDAFWARGHLFLTILLILLALGTHWTAWQRIRYLFKNL